MGFSIVSKVRSNRTKRTPVKILRTLQKCGTKQLAKQRDYYFYNNKKLEEGLMTEIKFSKIYCMHILFYIRHCVKISCTTLQHNERGDSLKVIYK